VEIITWGERRRSWALERKREIVAESLGPGLTLTEVARKHAISSGQLYTWRRQLLAVPSTAMARATPRFAAVDMASAPPDTPEPLPIGEPAPLGPPAPARAGGMIEIMLPCGVSLRVDAEVDGRALRRAPTARRRPKPRADRRARNHGALPTHLPRYEVVIDAEHTVCLCCGGAMHCIGESRTEQLDMVPAQLRVRVTRRPRYACRSCEGAVVVAPAPERPIDGGMPTEAVIAYVMVSKFCDSLPLYRQSQMLVRQGIALDRSTPRLRRGKLLSNWVGSDSWWLTPLYDLVLDPGRGRTKTGRLWCYAVDDRRWCGPSHPAVAYVYSEDRKSNRPAEHLARFDGVLQVDGYAGFKRLAGDRANGSVRLAFCWAHMRRDFLQFHASTKSPLAADLLARVAALYAIEAEIRRQSAEHRRQLRQDRSRPIVEALHGWLHDQVGRVSGASDLAKAMRYAIRHWPGLVAFLDDGRIEMDINVVERGARHPAPYLDAQECAVRRFRRRRASRGDCHDADPDREAERRRADGLAHRRARTRRLRPHQDL
jgi:transposase